MDRPQLIRRLRTVASVFFAVVTVALCVLWVRSYWQIDWLKVGRPTMAASFHSIRGNVLIDIGRPTVDNVNGYGSFDRSEDWRFVALDRGTLLGFKFDRYKGGCQIIAPLWGLAAVAATFATASFIMVPTSFSLRTLLIVTTLVAVVLGLGVWAAG